MSARGLCAEDSRLALQENIEGLHYHHGPAFDRWRRGMAASVGAVFVDNASESG